MKLQAQHIILKEIIDQSTLSEMHASDDNELGMLYIIRMIMISYCVCWAFPYTCL